MVYLVSPNFAITASEAFLDIVQVGIEDLFCQSQWPVEDLPDGAELADELLIGRDQGGVCFLVQRWREIGRRSSIGSGQGRQLTTAEQTSRTKHDFKERSGDENWWEGVEGKAAAVEGS